MAFCFGAFCSEDHSRETKRERVQAYLRAREYVRRREHRYHRADPCFAGVRASSACVGDARVHNDVAVYIGTGPNERVQEPAEDAVGKKGGRGRKVHPRPKKPASRSDSGHVIIARHH